MRRAAAYITLLAVGLSMGCGIDMPERPDGGGTISITVADTSGFISGFPGIPHILDSATVNLQSRTHDYLASRMTGPDGSVSFENLASGEYTLFARREIRIENNKKVFTGGGDIYIESPEVMSDTIKTRLVAASDLMINEIYYCGATCPYYYYDQFVELYNASQDTLYLDGIILTRQLQSAEPDMEEVDYVKAIYGFQFPGTPVTGRDYPILPGQFIVIASDAFDNTAWCETSVDLSSADWECFNPLGSDFDNPAVPNIVNINPSRTTDYMINLAHNAVVIATGEEYWYEETDTGSLYVIIPIYTIIDGVEYASSYSSTKELTIRVDAGFAGVGISKYSSQSAERKELGLDTNDSTFDFGIANPPTPGWSFYQ